MKEPKYYAENGLSPIGAFKQGLLSKEEYIGFCKGNIIKYVIRAGKKNNAVKDLEKARDYINFYLELIQETPIVNDIPITIKVNNDIDFDELKEKISESLEKANNQLQIIETPTDNENIMEIKLTDVMYDETGNLKPEIREQLKKYINERKNL